MFTWRRDVRQDYKLDFKFFFIMVVMVVVVVVVVMVVMVVMVIMVVVVVLVVVVNSAMGSAFTIVPSAGNMYLQNSGLRHCAV